MSTRPSSPDLLFERINPKARSRPEHCPLESKSTFYGLLNFEVMSKKKGEFFPRRYCPNHRKAIAKGTLDKERTELVPA